MLQWFIRFPELSEFLFPLGKTPLTESGANNDNQLHQVKLRMLTYLLWWHLYIKHWLLSTQNFALRSAIFSLCVQVWRKQVWSVQFSCPIHTQREKDRKHCWSDAHADDKCERAVGLIHIENPQLRLERSILIFPASWFDFHQWNVFNPFNLHVVYLII